MSTPAVDSDHVLTSRMRGMPLGTWLVSLVVFAGLGLLFMVAGLTGGASAAPLEWVGAVMIALPLLIVVWAMLQRCEVEVSQRGVRVLSRPQIDATWDQIIAVTPVMTMDDDREVLAFVLSAAGVREQIRRGRPPRPTHRIKVTKDAADVIKRLWAERGPHHGGPVEAVDCYIESSGTSPWLSVYIVLVVSRTIFTLWWALGLTLACALVAWMLLRDRRVTHIQADTQGLAIRGRLGYRVAWRDVEALVKVPYALTASDRVTLTLSAEAKRRIGWRRFLDGLTRVTVSVPRGVGADLVALHERALSSAEAPTPTSAEG